MKEFFQAVLIAFINASYNLHVIRYLGWCRSVKAYLSIFASKEKSMFDGPDFNKSLSEEVFNQWLENGRLSLLGHHYLLIVWDEYEADYQPVYVARREDIEDYKNAGSREKLIAAYDLYSESRIL